MADVRWAEVWAGGQPGERRRLESRVSQRNHAGSAQEPRRPRVPTTECHHSVGRRSPRKPGTLAVEGAVLTFDDRDGSFEMS